MVNNFGAGIHSDCLTALKYSWAIVPPPAREHNGFKG
jgi:hypothetical protein